MQTAASRPVADMKSEQSCLFFYELNKYYNTKVDLFIIVSLQKNKHASSSYLMMNDLSGRT